MKPIKREGFVFYRSFYEAVDNLSADSQAKVYKALMEYVFNAYVIELSGVEKSIFCLIKPQIDANNKKYLDGKKGKVYGKLGAKYGKLGGRPITPQEAPTNPPNANVKDKDNVLKQELLKKEIPRLDFKALSIKSSQIKGGSR